MKILFVGPSLPDASTVVGRDVIVRPPATQGDVIAAIEAGASVIGLIDGGFEYTAPVWHKEILFGLAAGVTILGASSMGALRAAECHPFGMIGIGRIFEGYRDGTLIDDADVALIHAPAEMNYRPLSVPMVNVTATLQWVVRHGAISRQEGEALDLAARTIFFKQRSWRRVVDVCQALVPERKTELKKVLPASEIDQKRHDALLLVERMDAPQRESAFAGDWTLQTTSIWRDKPALSSE